MKITPRHRRDPHPAWAYALLAVAALLLSGGVFLALAAVTRGYPLVAVCALLAATLGAVGLQRSAVELLADRATAARRRAEPPLWPREMPTAVIPAVMGHAGLVESISRYHRGAA